MANHFKILAVQLKNNFVREAVYRTNFITMVASDLVWIFIEFSMFAVIYANTQSLAGWSQPQTYFFLGIFFASDAIFTTFFQRNFWQFSDLVNKGELDILLTKPTSTIFLALNRWYNLTAWFNVLLGLGICYRYAGPAGFEGGLQWLVLIAWLFIGVLISVLIRFAFSICVFWTDRGWAISRLYFQFFQFATKPDTLYPKFIRYLILTALPFAFIASVPARALLHGVSLKEYLVLGLVIACFFTFDALMWRAGLRRYQSASS